MFGLTEEGLMWKVVAYPWVHGRLAAPGGGGEAREAVGGLVVVLLVHHGRRRREGGERELVVRLLLGGLLPAVTRARVPKVLHLDSWGHSREGVRGRQYGVVEIGDGKWGERRKDAYLQLREAGRGLLDSPLDGVHAHLVHQKMASQIEKRKCIYSLLWTRVAACSSAEGCLCHAPCRGCP